MASTFGIVKSAFSRAQDNNAGLLSAGVAYYAFLSLVPLLAAAVLTYGLVADAQTIAEHTARLAMRLPASASEVIEDQLRSITEDRSGAQGIGLLLAIALSLFGARAAAKAVITAFNVAFDAEESRGFIKANLLALCITIGALVAIGVVIATTSFITFALSEGLARFAGFLVVGLAGFGGALAAYRIVPNVGDVTTAQAARGALPFAIVWMIASSAFGFYAANFGNYNATYGSLGAVVILLTWLFLSAYLLLFGAFVAAESRASQT
jgi:membrane protein